MGLRPVLRWQQIRLSPMIPEMLTRPCHTTLSTNPPTQPTHTSNNLLEALAKCLPTRPPACAHRHKHTNTQRHRDTEIQGHPNTATQREREREREAEMRLRHKDREKRRYILTDSQTHTNKISHTHTHTLTLSHSLTHAYLRARRTRTHWHLPILALPGWLHLSALFCTEAPKGFQSLPHVSFGNLVVLLEPGHQWLSSSSQRKAATLDATGNLSTQHRKSLRHSPTDPTNSPQIHHRKWSMNISNCIQEEPNPIG